MAEGGAPAADAILEFSEAKNIAEKWSKSGLTKFALVAVDEYEMKLVFRYQDISFYVLGQDCSSGKWNVWSECEEVIGHMAAIQDYVHSCTEKGLKDILNYIDHKLQPLVRKPVVGAAAAQNNEEDADEVDDGYDEDGDEGYEDDDDDVEDDPSYYQDDDLGDLGEGEARNAPDLASSPGESLFTGKATQIAVHRILKDLKTLQDSHGKYGVEGAPKSDNLLIWEVKLKDFPKNSGLGKDLDTFAQKYNREPVIYMEMEFPPDYPMAPPFVRVLRPRFKFLTGHITVGGSICMEMLTKSGWRPTNDIESMLVQIRSEIMSDQEAQLEPNNPDREYDKAAAQTAFHRMVERYGWNK